MPFTPSFLVYVPSLGNYRGLWKEVLSTPCPKCCQCTHHSEGHKLQASRLSLSKSPSSVPSPTLNMFPIWAGCAWSRISDGLGCPSSWGQGLRDNTHLYLYVSLFTNWHDFLFFPSLHTTVYFWLVAEAGAGVSGNSTEPLNFLTASGDTIVFLSTPAHSPKLVGVRILS